MRFLGDTRSLGILEWSRRSDAASLSHIPFTLTEFLRIGTGTSSRPSIVGRRLYITTSSAWEVLDWPSDASSIGFADHASSFSTSPLLEVSLSYV